jgi:hypothetical protein
MDPGVTHSFYYLLNLEEGFAWKETLHRQLHKFYNNGGATWQPADDEIETRERDILTLILLMWRIG